MRMIPAALFLPLLAATSISAAPPVPGARSTARASVTILSAERVRPIGERATAKSDAAKGDAPAPLQRQQRPDPKAQSDKPAELIEFY